MLRALAIFALLFQLVAGALPTGSVVHFDHHGSVVLSGSCCAMDGAGPDPTLGHAGARSVECCCFIGVLIGHEDLQSAPPPAVALPVSSPVVVAWFDPAAAPRQAAVPRADSREHPPPPLGLVRPLTVVIRC